MTGAQRSVADCRGGTAADVARDRGRLRALEALNRTEDRSAAAAAAAAAMTTRHRGSGAAISDAEWIAKVAPRSPGKAG